MVDDGSFLDIVLICVRLPDEPDYARECAHLTKEAVSLIKWMLIKPEQERPTATEVLKHPWFRQANVTVIQISPIICENMKVFPMIEAQPDATPPRALPTQTLLWPGAVGLIEFDLLLCAGAAEIYASVTPQECAREYDGSPAERYWASNPANKPDLQAARQRR